MGKLVKKIGSLKTSKIKETGNFKKKKKKKTIKQCI